MIWRQRNISERAFPAAEAVSDPLAPVAGLQLFPLLSPASTKAAGQSDISLEVRHEYRPIHRVFCCRLTLQPESATIRGRGANCTSKGRCAQGALVVARRCWDKRIHDFHIACNHCLVVPLVLEGEVDRRWRLRRRRRIWKRVHSHFFPARNRTVHDDRSTEKLRGRQQGNVVTPTSRL